MTQPLKYILCWLLFPLALFANHVQWLGDYDKALQKAHQEHKPLLVLVVKHKDPLSSKIIKNYFMNHTYVDKINQEMVPVIVTYEGRTSYPIEMYYTRVFPTLFFVDSSREIFFREPLYAEEITQEKVQEIVGWVFQPTTIMHD